MVTMGSFYTTGINVDHDENRNSWEPVRKFVCLSHTMNYSKGERYGKEARRRHLTRAAG